MVGDEHPLNAFQRSLEESGLEDAIEPLPPIRLERDNYFENEMEQLIGGGTTREVFKSKMPGMIIKRSKPVQVNGELFSFPGSNMREFSVWNAVRQGEYRELFGEVFAISESGKFLMMETLVDLRKEQWTETPSLPDWASDLKPSNFGINNDGVIKLRDYGMCDISKALNSAKTYRYAWQIK